MTTIAPAVQFSVPVKAKKVRRQSSVGKSLWLDVQVADLLFAHLEERSRGMDVYRSGSTVRVECPAKVNLFLEVLARRADGFHEIETLMTAISIYDSLNVTEAEEGRIRVTCNWVAGREAKQTRQGDCLLLSLPAETDNLVYRAARRLMSQSGADRGANIQLIKRIPVEAGLGGASSDAAATLLALNAFWQLNWSREKLAELASELGSDVPFFLLDRTAGSMAAVCRGRGERITKLPGVYRGALVVLKPKEGLSTAKVYSRCSVPQTPVSVEPLVAALQAGRWNDIRRALFNRLQEVAETMSPRVREMREICEKLDVVGHAMSGSGTSYFAICRSAAQAYHLANRLRAMDCGLVFQAAMI